MTQQNFNVLKPHIILGVAAHPDDLDYSAAGSFASFASQGAAVHYLILTDGSKGTSDREATAQNLRKIREKEQQESLRAIGAKSVQFLGYPDGELVVTMELKKEIVKTIRQLKPDVVVTFDPSMLYSANRGFINHPDHRAAGQATLDAVFPLARDHLSFPELDNLGFKPHKVKTILLANFNETNFRVDITKTIDRKIEALKAHKSQVSDITATEIRIRKLAEEAGQPAGFKYAEQFVRIDIL